MEKHANSEWTEGRAKGVSINILPLSSPLCKLFSWRQLGEGPTCCSLMPISHPTPRLNRLASMANSYVQYISYFIYLFERILPFFHSLNLLHRQLAEKQIKCHYWKLQKLGISWTKFLLINDTWTFPPSLKMLRTTQPMTILLSA